MTNWQPIETAPKEGTEILLTVKYRSVKSRVFTQVLTAQFCKQYQEWIATSGDEIDGTATHWMPLPEAPPAE